MERTPSAVFSTVGHMAQTAMVKSAAGCDFWNSTSPSGSQASGETGRSSWKRGSSPRANSFERPTRNPSGVPISKASAYPFATSTSEYQVKRRMPWSSSPRLAKGSRTYGLLASQVLAGEGRFWATVADTAAHSPRMRRKPSPGSSTAWARPLAIDSVATSGPRARDVEGGGVRLGLRGIEHLAVEEGLRPVVTAAVLVA